jgi:protein involved in polysaccharide export with SLBB domain
MTSLIRSFGRSALAVLLVVAAPGVAVAQLGQDNERLASRTALETEARNLERAAASTAYSERTRGRALQSLAQVRRRLSTGDFAVGQRVVVMVTTSNTEGRQQLANDTLTVLDSLVIDIPGVRRISLAGVLRSELVEKVTREIGIVVRNAEVIVRPLVRIAVLGSVNAPGFLAVPSETLLDQLLTMSGGPANNAPIEKMQVMRGDTVLLKGEDVMAAISEGRTIDALNLRDGDALVVAPAPTPWDRSAVLSIVSLVVSPLITLVLVR